MTLEKDMDRKVPRVLSMFLIAAAGLTPVSARETAPEKTDVFEVCQAGEGGAALLIQVENIRSVEGNLRAQAYGADPEDFLEKGKWIKRVDDPVTMENEQSVCVQMPAPGKYAFVVMHDRNANGKADFFSEGFGFTNNPKLALAPPDGEEVIFDVPAGVTKTTVRLKYILGSDSEKKKKRRKLRRR
jgi:uncharacterized protein (DUF2141 family)